MKCERCGSDQLETSDINIEDDCVIVDGYCMDCKNGCWYFTSTYKLKNTKSWSEEWEGDE